MAQNKHKTKRRIICILCASIIALYALAVPIGAVVNADQGGFEDFNLYAQSTFPLTVGFSYVTRDLSTGAGNTYVYATDIGGFGEESNQTIFGNDTYTQNYTPIDGTTYELEGNLTYNFIDTQFPDDAAIQWTDGSHTSRIERGWREISMMNKAPSGGNISGLQQGVVLRARDVVYNPKWLTVYDDSSTHYEDWMLPMFATPTVDSDMVSTNATVLTYSWSCTITDGNGNVHKHSGVETFDTREDNSGILQEIIPIDVLLNYTNYDTIIINEYQGFLDVDYYEYTEPVDDSIVGTWVLNSVIDNSMLNSDISSNNAVTFNFNAQATPSGTVSISSVMGSDISIYKDSTFCFNLSNVTLKGGTVPYSGLWKYSSAYSSYPDGFKTYYYTSGSDYERTFSTTSSYFSLLSTVEVLSLDTSTQTNIDFIDVFSSWLRINAIKQGSTATVAEGTWEEVPSSGDGYLLKLRYPLYNTAGVIITDSKVYQENMAKYAFPTMAKYIDTDNTYIPPMPDYEADYTGWLGSAVGGFLDFELFPGFSLGGLLGILIGFSFVMLFLKFFAGG